SPAARRPAALFSRRDGRALVRTRPLPLPGARPGRRRVDRGSEARLSPARARAAPRPPPGCGGRRPLGARAPLRRGQCRLSKIGVTYEGLSDSPEPSPAPLPAAADRLVCFELAGQQFGVPIRAVKETLP